LVEITAAHAHNDAQKEAAKQRIHDTYAEESMQFKDSLKLQLSLQTYFVLVMGMAALLHGSISALNLRKSKEANNQVSSGSE
jgi:hypothetical protein